MNKYNIFADQSKSKNLIINSKYILFSTHTVQIKCSMPRIFHINVLERGWNAKTIKILFPNNKNYLNVHATPSNKMCERWQSCSPYPAWSSFWWRTGWSLRTPRFHPCYCTSWPEHWMSCYSSGNLNQLIIKINK